MKDAQKETVLAHCQHVARHFQALATSIDKICELVRHSIGEAAPSADEISLFLRRESTMKELEHHRETALFQSADTNKQWRLISLAVQADPTKAAALLARRPPSSYFCSFCWIDEGRSFDREDLVLEKDLYGEAVDNVRLHKQCVRPWLALRAVVENAKCTTT